MNTFEKYFCKFVESHELNFINAKLALSEKCIDVKLFDTPIFAYANANSQRFIDLKKAVGEHFKLPKEWNSCAKTVISIFFPFTDEIIKSNENNDNFPSDLWLHGRIEGQAFIAEASAQLESYFSQNGFSAISPCISDKLEIISDNDINTFTSNWSERHIGFACGLGTFGLCKGIITKKGMAGRLTSIITEASFLETDIEYTDIYEYCAMCGKCISRCPAKAISLDKGKEHLPCSLFIDTVLLKTTPRYGCGKCQTKVPCARKIPRKR